MSEHRQHPSQPTIAATNQPIQAVYENGVIRPTTPLDLPSGTPLDLHFAPSGTVIATPRRVRWWPGINANVRARGLLGALTWLELALLAASVTIYLVTRTVGLSRFPIYFFSDEAIQVNHANMLLHNGLRDTTGTLLPSYFRNVEKWSLSFTVYTQLVGTTLFGTSITGARLTSVVAGLLGTLALTGVLKDVLKLRMWWVAPLVLAVIPAWFYHGRTAFETATMAAMYACFVASYLLYRYRSPRYMYAAIVFGAATFYSYSNGQGVMLFTGALLLVSDARYHWQQRRMFLPVVLLGALMALPYVRFRLTYPGALREHLQNLDSYWLQPVPLSQKLATFASIYVRLIDPRYWFFPNELDLVRHRFRGLGHLGQYLLPFVLTGLGRCVWYWRSSAYRVVLVALLAAPFAAALVPIQSTNVLITRALAMVVPIALLACIGIEQCWFWLARWRVPWTPVALGTATAFGTLAVLLLRTALINGPTWYTEYGLYGMQYGAAPLFGAVKEELARSPDARLLVTHTWANNPNAFVPFFLNDAEQRRVEITTIEPFMASVRTIDPNAVFVMTAKEYDAAQASNKFTIEPPLRVVPYPNGTPGFYLARVQYSPYAPAIFAAERAERERLVDALAVLDGQSIPVRHSPIDLGGMNDLFDNNTETLIRGAQANPLVIEFRFPTPQSIGTISIDGWSPHIALAAAITASDGSTSRWTQEFRDQGHNPHIDWTLPDGPHTASVLRLEIKNATDGEVSKVHVRNIALQP